MDSALLIGVVAALVWLVGFAVMWCLSVWWSRYSSRKRRRAVRRYLATRYGTVPEPLRTSEQDDSITVSFVNPETGRRHTIVFDTPLGGSFVPISERVD